MTLLHPQPLMQKVSVRDVETARGSFSPGAPTHFFLIISDLHTRQHLPRQQTKHRSTSSRISETPYSRHNKNPHPTCHARLGIVIIAPCDTKRTKITLKDI